MTKLQADRLKKLARFIRKVPPAKFDMNSFIYDPIELGEGDRMNLKCDTTACMAGWATAIFPELHFDECGTLRVKNKIADGKTLRKFFGVGDVFFNWGYPTPEAAAKTLLRAVTKFRKNS